MKKTFLAAAILLGICLPVAAEKITDRDIYDPPIAGEEHSAVTDAPVQSDDTAERQEEVIPINLSASHAAYDSKSGDFYANGNVVVTQGEEKMVSPYVFGNMKTGDLYLVQGGALVEGTSVMNGSWVHYNFNTKTGEIIEIKGENNKGKGKYNKSRDEMEYYNAPHAFIFPDKIVGDQGGTFTNCPAVEHPACLLVEAKTFEIYPRDRIVGHDVKVYLRGKHIYSRDLWVNNFNDEDSTKITFGFGKDGDNGWYAKATVIHPLDEKTHIRAVFPQYSDAKYKPSYGISHYERNFIVRYSNAWDEDDGDWYYKQNNWVAEYKKHYFVDGIPLSYSASIEYGLWQKWDVDHRKKVGHRSWHREIAAYIDHDPIYFFNSKNTALRLRFGRKWVNESYNDDSRKTDIYHAQLDQIITDKWRTWVAYHQEEETSALFDLNNPDMEEEVRNGLEFKPDTKNTFTIINRHDVGKGKPYEIDYIWLHKFCCWTLEVEYEFDRDEDDRTLSFHYYYDF